jgi:hypothetical protein
MINSLATLTIVGSTFSTLGSIPKLCRTPFLYVRVLVPVLPHKLHEVHHARLMCQEDTVAPLSRVLVPSLLDLH